MFEFLEEKLQASERKIFKKLVSMHLSSKTRTSTELVKLAVLWIDKEARKRDESGGGSDAD
jgi:hypothetical protein